MPDLRMSKAEREAFLREHVVGVLGVPADGKAPLMMPVLYRYEPNGNLVFTYDKATEKATRIDVGTPVALSVEVHKPWASGYVTIEGVVERVQQDDERAELRRLAEPYYGSDAIDSYMSVVPPEWVMQVAYVRPTRFLTRDYEKLGIAKRD